MMKRETLEDRYFTESEGNIQQMFARVANYVAQVESEPNKWEERFYDLMNDNLFLPNSPTLMNAGTELPQMSACFVLPIEDSMDSIFGTLRNAARVWKSGGGTGFDFSRIRPKGSLVKSTGGRATGPVSFIDVYNKAADTVVQGGKRPGANMAILRVDHPDIDDFLDAKTEEGKFTNFNFSVGITKEFMKALFHGHQFFLGSKSVGPGRIWKKIVTYAWGNGEPGVVFLDRINEDNPFEEPMRTTNPCGEQPLLPYESCNLGSINLAEFTEAYLGGEVTFDWNKLEDAVQVAVRFLDDVLTMNEFPLDEIREKTLQTRKIGLGVMGWHEALARMGLHYDSVEAFGLAEETMKFIDEVAKTASTRLVAVEGRKPFPRWKEAGLNEPRRNLTLTTLAPTGSISQIADTTPGIEPAWALEYEASGSLRRFEWADEDTKTALEIDPEAHIQMQAAFQKYTDNAVSKTVNLSNGVELHDVSEVFWQAYKSGCKGVTVYRNGSRELQANNCPECENILQ